MASRFLNELTISLIQIVGTVRIVCEVNVAVAKRGTRY